MTPEDVAEPTTETKNQRCKHDGVILDMWPPICGKCGARQTLEGKWPDEPAVRERTP